MPGWCSSPSIATARYARPRAIRGLPDSCRRRSVPMTTPPSSPRRCRPSRTTCAAPATGRSEEHTSELQSQSNLVCRLLLEKKKRNQHSRHAHRLIPKALLVYDTGSTYERVRNPQHPLSVEGTHEAEIPD